MTKINSLAQKASEHSSYSQESSRKGRIMYPAIVVPNGTDDASEQNRIKARIVYFNEDTGKIDGNTSESPKNYDQFAGLDIGIPDSDLVMCVPLFPQFFFSKPQVGEMVYVIMENPNDKTSVRYWIGPIISSKLKLSYQNYEDAVSIYDKTLFYNNKLVGNVPNNLTNIFPQDSDIAIQGRKDADLILKNREALLIAGKFNNKSFQINNESPSYLRLKQIDSTIKEKQKKDYPPPTHSIIISLKENNSIFLVDIKVTIKESLVLENRQGNYNNRQAAIDFFKENIQYYKKKYPSWKLETNDIKEFENENKFYYTDLQNKKTEEVNNLLTHYSIAELTSTNLLLYSPRGKFRDKEMTEFEKSEDLKSFSDLAQKLHPAVFGDELIKLLNLIIKYLLSHIHQPQKAPLPTALSESIKTYTIDGDLQRIISNHIRIN